MFACSLYSITDQFLIILILAPCSSNPCKNDGSCKINGGSYQCDCPVGFSGIQCEISNTIRKFFNFT